MAYPVEAVKYYSWLCNAYARNIFRQLNRKMNKHPSVIFVSSRQSLFCGGKVKPHKFFPQFCQTLNYYGIETYFTTRIDSIENIRSDQTCVIVVDCEEREWIHNLSDCDKLGLVVFNSPSSAPKIANKRLTNEILTSNGILMPKIICNTKSSGIIFSNAINESNAPAHVIAQQQIDPARYNTEFIDTSVKFEGKSYYTCLRMLCVGSFLVHAWVRARPHGYNPSVHSKDTPRCPALLEKLQQQMVVDRQHELTTLALRLGEILGPGFYAHDILIERETGKMFVCETGWKFDDFTFRDHIAPIARHVPSHAMMFDKRLAIRSAEAFLKQCNKLNCF